MYNVCAVYQHLYVWLVCIPASLSSSAACMQDAFKRLIMAAACTQYTPLFFMQWRHDISVKPQKQSLMPLSRFIAVVLMAVILVYAPGVVLTNKQGIAVQKCSRLFQLWQASKGRG